MRIAADATPFEVQRDRHVVPAAIELADEPLFRDTDILEEHLIELVPARHVDQRPHGHARGAHIEQEEGDAFVFWRGRF